MGGDASASRDVAEEAARRRTFAVISHPDAGKSTLTEALALHAAAIDEAGAVHGKAGRAVVDPGRPPRGGRATRRQARFRRTDAAQDASRGIVLTRFRSPETQSG